MMFDIRAAVARLNSRSLERSDSLYAIEAAVRQFNGYLSAAQKQYPESIDISCLTRFISPSIVKPYELSDAIGRLLEGLEILPEDVESDKPLLSQKFGILRAEKQLDTDFVTYMNDHGGLGILFFDVDNFKKYNTKYTETIVDQSLLRPLQNLLLDITQSRGFAYSVGGDEFIILLRNTSSPEALAFGYRLSETVRNHRFQIAGATESLTLSIGVACYSGNAITLPELRLLANQAERQAKEEGRDRVVLVDQ